MAYRRPAIEVIQEFQEAAAALALPNLPACIIGPAFQVVDDANAGVYSEDDLATTSYAYPNLAAGGVVDLDDAPTDEEQANAHKSVGVTLKDAYIKAVPDYPVASRLNGALSTPNVFTDNLSNAFASFDPDAAGAPRYYIDIIACVVGGFDAADLGRKLIIAKTDANTLVVAAEWQSTLPIPNGVEYRILEYREEEEYDEDDFSDNGITKDADSVDIDPGLMTTSDSTPKWVVEGDIYLSWRALRPDLAGTLTEFTDFDSLEAVFGVGSIVPANIGPYAVNLAKLNTTTGIQFVGLGANWFTNEEQAYQTALEFLESEDVYALALMTQTTAIHQTAKAHVVGMSLSSVGRERVCFLNRLLSTYTVLVPPSGIGTVTSAGTNNGLAGVDNKTFKDPTNGSFITDDVNTGHYLEITSYTAVRGVQRSLTPSPRDYLSVTPDTVRLGNAAFTAADVARIVLMRGCTTAANDAIAYTIASITSAAIAVVSTPNTAEVLPASTRTWICAAPRLIADDPLDEVVSTTKTWTFENGAFTATDVGRLMKIDGTGGGTNDGIFTIASVIDAKNITTLEAPGVSEDPLVSTGINIYPIVREVAVDAVADSVNGTTYEWTFINGNFTADDVGRLLQVTGATNAGNNENELGGNPWGHLIEAVISGTVVRTTTTTQPVDEEFDGLTNGPLTILDITSVAPNATEAAYITGTRHAINVVTSETQFSLVSDPGAGFGGTLEDVVYRITDDMTLNEQATAIAGYSTSLGTRRAVATWPDILAVSVNSVATKVPGYFACAALAGMTAGLPSQAGFTNLTLTGFVGRENSDDKFSDTQLDTIAGGGTMVLIQPVVDTALLVRHQLTTDVSTIQFQEFSVTKNVDLEVLPRHVHAVPGQVEHHRYPDGYPQDAR
jgi:hypothetical protein